MTDLYGFDTPTTQTRSRPSKRQTGRATAALPAPITSPVLVEDTVHPVAVVSVPPNKKPAKPVSEKLAAKLESAQEFVEGMSVIIGRLDEQASDDVNYQFLRLALQETLDMIPLAKANYMLYQTQSNAYTYSGLITKCQELIGDMQSMSDQHLLVERLFTNVVDPAISSIAVNFSNAYTVAVADIQALSPDPATTKVMLKIFKDFLMSTGQYIQEQRNSIQEQFSGAG